MRALQLLAILALAASGCGGSASSEIDALQKKIQELEERQEANSETAAAAPTTTSSPPSTTTTAAPTTTSSQPTRTTIAVTTTAVTTTASSQPTATTSPTSTTAVSNATTTSSSTTIPAVPYLSAPSSVTVESSTISVPLPSKPSGFDSYGQTMGVYIFDSPSATGASSSSVKQACGSWSYNSAPWGSTCSFNKTNLTPATYYARYYLTDKTGRTYWSSSHSFTVSTPALPSLAAPSTVTVGSSTISVPLPSKPSGFDSYGQTLGVYIFDNSFSTSTSSSYMKQTCGSWSYNSAPWGSTCSFNKTNLTPATYYARYYLTDNQGRSEWSSSKSFTVSAPALPTFGAPSAVTIGSSTISVPLPSKPSGFNSYGQTFGVYIFNNSYSTGTYSSSMKQTCGSWSYNSAPWNGTCSFNKTSLSTGTYYARYYLTDNQSRISWSSGRSFTLSPPTTTTTTTTTTTAPANQEQQAASRGQSYLNLSAFSRSGLISQLEFEGFTNADATAGVDSLSVDWNAQAVLKGQSYLNLSAFSRSGLISQLEFEGFTNVQATYGVDSLSADWNAQAVLKGQSYLNLSAFSRSGLISQLEFEGFTNAQATHAVDQLFD